VTWPWAPVKPRPGWTRRSSRTHYGAAWLLADDLPSANAAERVIIRARLDLAQTRSTAEAGHERRVTLGLLTDAAAGGEPPRCSPNRGHRRGERGCRRDTEPLAGELPEVSVLLVEAIGEDEAGSGDHRRTGRPDRVGRQVAG
jgi:hypothetical protein